MSSESQVKNIMECIDEGLKELGELEEKLERYDRLLQVRNNLHLTREYQVQEVFLIKHATTVPGNN